MAHWAQSPIDRGQVTLFAPTLDDTVRPDHPVRLFDEVLRSLDFGDWERAYVRVAGRPPIHPRVLAACVLYGLSLGIRSSRRLQDAAANRLDFLWLLEGHAPDHATICGFRTAFGEQVKALFRQVGRVAMGMGLVALNLVTPDGTDLRASNARTATARRPSLTAKLAALDAQVDRMPAEAGAQDRAEDALFGGPAGSPATLPPALRDLRRRQARLRDALANLGAVEDARDGRADRRAKPPAVPTTDPEARVIPGKQGGGYAPGYTAVLAVDARDGFVVDAQVVDGNDEASTVLPAVTNVADALGRRPDRVVADANFNAGPVLAGLDRRGVEPLMPARQAFPDNPAPRADPTQPVPEALRARLPVSPQNKGLDKAAFVYDAAKDRYLCPMGHALARGRAKRFTRGGTGAGTYRLYTCAAAACAACPLAARCLPRGGGGGDARRARTVSRDEHEGLREAMAARLATPDGQSQYKRRAWAAETPFAVLKAVMNVRQLLHRGLAKVRAEVRWAATAYNLVKLTRHWRPAAARTA